MKVTFEGTPIEIKKEISIFLEGTLSSTFYNKIENNLPIYPTREPNRQKLVIEIRKWIASHVLDDQLPSETKIAKAHGVTRMTARAAVNILKDEGLVYSQNQKTFINRSFT